VKYWKMIMAIALTASLVLSGSSCIFTSFLGGDSGHPEAAIEMMKMIPSDQDGFIYFDVQQLREDDELDPLYTGVSTILVLLGGMCGIDSTDVKHLGMGDAMLFGGEFDVSETASELEDNGYKQTEYQGVGVWHQGDALSLGPGWIVLQEDMLIAGDEDDVKVSIDVMNGNADSLYDEGVYRDILDKLPGGFMLFLGDNAFTEDDYDGFEVGGMSVVKKDSDIVMLTAVMQFESEDAAQSAIEGVRSDLEGDSEAYENIELQRDGRFLKATFEQGSEDVFDDSLGSMDDTEGDASDIKILSHSGGVDYYGWYTVLGEVKNTGSDNLSWVKITVTYYDSNSAELDTSHSYTTIDTLAPGQRSPFETCVYDETVANSIATYSIECTSVMSGTAPYTDLEFIDHSLGSDSFGNTIVAGQVKNTGSDTVNYATIVVSFYDASGKLIAIEWDFTDPADVAPGETGTFEATLWDDDIAQDIASYDVQVDT